MSKEEMIVAENLCMIYQRVKEKKDNNFFSKLLSQKDLTDFEALKNVSFRVYKGEIVGYLGPNGAGKSTTIKILSGVMQPTNGCVTVNGIVPYKERIKNAQNIALVSGQRSNLLWDLPVYESFELHKRIYQVSNKTYHEKISQFNQITNIQNFFSVPVRQLSLGQRIIADFCLALLHNPLILYLDEPTIGLDVIAKEKIVEYLKELNSINDTTIFLTSHDLSDIEKLCSRVIVLDSGQKIYERSTEQLIYQYGNKCNEIRIITENRIMDFVEVHELPVNILRVEENLLQAAFDINKISAVEIILLLANKGVRVKDFSISNPTLEDAIKVIYSKGKW